jgi:hypothetical protein
MNRTKKFKRGTCSNCRGKNKRIMKYKSVQICGPCIMKATIFTGMDKLAACKMLRKYA